MPAIDGDARVVVLDLEGGTTMHRVVFEEVGQGVDISNVIGCHEFDLVVAMERTGKVAPNTAEAIHGDSNSHLGYLWGFGELEGSRLSASSAAPIRPASLPSAAVAMSFAFVAWLTE